MSKTYALFSTAANRKIIAHLEEKGETVFQFKPIETFRKENTNMLENKLAETDWIIFPDIYAVDHFVEILEANGTDLFELDAAHTVAVGEAVADRLRFSQLHADIIPANLEAETIFSSLTDYLGGASPAGLNFLIPKGAGFDLEFAKLLTEAGAEVSEIEVYDLDAAPEKNKTANLKALLKGGAIDEFILTSAEDVFSLQNWLSPENLPEYFAETKTSGTNEISVQTLRENNLRPGFFAVR